MEKNIRSPTSFIEFKKEDMERSILDRFEYQVNQYPDQIAVKAQDQALSYDALNRVANRIGRAILAQNDENQKPIALLFGFDTSAIVGILAVLKAGKIYVPLDPTFPPARISYMLEDSQANVIVTNTKYLPVATSVMANLSVENKPHLINIDEIGSNLSDENLGLDISPDTLSAIFHTSGSTTQPKGVMWNHRNLLHHVSHYTNDHHIGPNDRQALLFSYSFSVSMPEIFSALLNGATLYLYNPKEAGLTQLANWLLKEKITIFHPPVAFFRHFLDTLTGSENFPDLRVILLGGQTVHPQDVERFQKSFTTDCILVNQLASTEANLVARFVVDHQTTITGSHVPVGYPVKGKEILLLDDAGKEVGPEQIGEIAVKSRYLTPGYWQRPDLTQQAFLSNSATNDNQRIYLTGDLGRLRSDGSLEYLGRKDFRVKIRGYRVEMEEIETTLRALDTIKDAVVVAQEIAAQENQSGDKRLVAYLIPSDQPPPSISAVRSALAETLADYMIPSAFVFLDTFPLTANGKIDRWALPVPEQTRLEPEDTFVAPRDELELQMTEIWEKVLDIRPIGVQDNFFDLGGHSLLAVSLFAQIDKVLGHDLPLATLFQAPTIEQMVNLLRQEDWSPEWSVLVSIQPTGSKPPFFCVHAVGGNVLSLRDLGRHLGSDQPFYALQSQGLNGRQVPPSRVEEMASHYIEEIQTIQSKGPYFLAGQSSGGMVALEMAQQLQTQGQQIAFLGLIDTHGHLLKVSRFDKIAFHWHEFLQFGPKYIVDRLSLRLRKIGPVIQDKMVPLVKAFYQKIDRPLPHGFRHIFVERVMYRAARYYVPQSYSGRIVFFRATNTVQAYVEDKYRLDRGWRAVAGDRLEICNIPGAHNLEQEPHVGTLAKHLKAYLEKAQEKYPLIDHA